MLLLVRICKKIRLNKGDETNGNIFEEDDENDEELEKKKRKMGYYDEQDELKKRFVRMMNLELKI